MLPVPQETQRAKPSNTRFPFFARCLFLGSLGLGSIALALLASTLVPGGAAGLAQLDVGAALDRSGHVALADLLEGDVGGGDGEGGGDEGGLLDLGQVGLGVALLGGVGLAGQQDQALLVGLKAGDVGSKGLLAEVLAAVVDGDTDGGSQLAGDASLLQRLLDAIFSHTNRLARISSFTSRNPVQIFFLRTIDCREIIP